MSDSPTPSPSPSSSLHEKLPDSSGPMSPPTIEIEDTENPASQRTRQLPSVTAKSSSNTLTSPFSNISSYAHEATTVPPYVLYGIANSAQEHKIHEKPLKAVHRDDHTHLMYQDPFMSSLGGNWSTFFQTVDNTPAYADGVLFHDTEALAGLPDLNEKWGGEERLIRAMNKETPNPPSSGKKFWFLPSASSSSSSNPDTQKRRSKARYWMSQEKREEWGPYLRRVFLSNNYVPLFFRIFIIVLSIIALALSVRIFQISKRKVQLIDDNSEVAEVSQQPSTLMAICVQSIGLVYLMYISYDEFQSQPLGIRNPVEKMRLILLDLLFIIFSSANLALSFNTLYDGRWVCTTDTYSKYPRVESICQLQKGLCAFLFVILIAWVVTFAISIMRVILKVSSSHSNHGGR